MEPHPVISLPSSTEPLPAAGSVHFVGTATVLLRLGGFTILTDPNFLHQGEHARLGYGLRSRRLTEPSMAIAELPHLDAIVLSHHHGDHFDDRAADELRKDVPIITTAHAAEKLARQGFTDARPLATWESQVLRRGGRELRATSLPGRHGPGALDRLLPDVMGTMLDLSEDGELLHRIYISGDTLLHDRLEEIPPRFPGVDLGLFHLGGTRILGVMLTMDARQGVRAMRLIDPDVAIPIHYDDYTVFRSGLDELSAELAGSDLEHKVRYLERGDEFAFAIGMPTELGEQDPPRRS